MSLSNALVSTSQPERGGEVAIRGFEYQASFGISYLLEKHALKKEYVFIFEYHDDILVLDSDVAPSSSEFIQVKTKQNGVWTIASVINATAKKPISFIAKLYRHFLNFKSYPIELLFVSNAGFDFITTARCKAESLDEITKNKIVEKVTQQIEGIETVRLENLEFVTSDLSLTGYSSHLKGKICDFLDDVYGVEHGINVSSLTSVLVKICNDKARVSSDTISNFEDLIKKKGITSGFIDDVLSKINSSKEQQPCWRHVLTFFQNDSDLLELIELESIFNRVAVRLGDVNSLYYHYLCEICNHLDFGVIFDIKDIKQSFNDFIILADAPNPTKYDILNNDEKKIIIAFAVIKKALRRASSGK